MKQILSFMCLIIGLLLGEHCYAQQTNKFFNYKLKGYPKDMPCYLIAKDLQQKFYEETKIQHVRADCIAEDINGFDIIIKYEADEPVKIVSTEEGSFVWPAGAYTTKEECIAKSNIEKQVFKDETGLNPFVAYCYKNNYVSQFPWELRIDAFGTSNVKSFRNGLLLWGIPVNASSYELFIKELQDILYNMEDTKVSYVVVRPKLVYLELVIRYYASKPLNLKLMSFGSFTNKAECALEYESLIEIFNALEFKTLKSYCSNVLAIQNIELNALYKEIENFRVIQLLEKYKTFSECLENKDAVLQYQKEVIGRPVVGGICTKNLEDHFYVIKSFERL